MYIDEEVLKGWVRSLARACDSVGLPCFRFLLRGRMARISFPGEREHRGRHDRPPVALGANLPEINPPCGSTPARPHGPRSAETSSKILRRRSHLALRDLHV